MGPNVAMLDPYNRLTDIGSWYLGGNATGNLPSYDGSSGAGQGDGNGGDETTSCSAAHPCGNGNGGSRAGGIGAGLGLVSALAGLSAMVGFA